MQDRTRREDRSAKSETLEQLQGRRHRQDMIAMTCLDDPKEGTSACQNRHAPASRGKSSIDSTGRRTIEMLAAQHAKPNAQEPKRLQASTIVPIYPSDPASIAADARSDRGRASRRQVNGIRAVPQSLPRQATAHALHAEASATHAMWHGGVLPRVYVKPVCILLCSLAPHRAWISFASPRRGHGRMRSGHIPRAERDFPVCQPGEPNRRTGQSG